MILAHLKALESSGVTFCLEEVEAELKRQFLPENFEDNLDSLAAESVSLLCRQIVHGIELGSERLEGEMKGFFPLGYITGFTIGVLETTYQKDKRVKIMVLQMVFDKVFGAEGKELFLKVIEYLGSQQVDFRKGLDNGLREAVECVELENEPAGLKYYLVNN